MNIQNVRVGFNTSSSSQHSAVINVNPKLSFDPPDGLYGWGDFILKTADEKEHYFATMLFCNLVGLMPDHYAIAIVNSLFGKPILNEGGAGFDHQSVFEFPTKPSGWYRSQIDEINWEFFQDLIRHYADNPEIAICGGNDNDKGPNYGKEDSLYNLLFSHLADRNDGFLARKDGDFWVLFNKRTGTKLRISFASKAQYKKSTYPESVDIKITDFCPFECDFCYQDSTLQGSFGNPRLIKDIARVLSNFGVFEVALGGGEPTLHPHLKEIIHEFAYNGICVNLTTRNKSWIENTSLAKTILEEVSGLAFSVGGGDYKTFFDMEDVVKWLRMHNYKGELSAHYVLGYDTTDQTIGYLTRLAGQVSRITLLGFKPTGRARTHRPVKINMKKVLEHCKKHYYTLGMDTKAVQDYRKEIKAAGVSKVLLTGAEGKFSLYIDAVQHFVAPDSYTEASKTIPFGCENNRVDSLQKVIEENFPF